MNMVVIGGTALIGTRVVKNLRDTMNEVFPLERVNKAYERKMSGNVRFRTVLKMK